jgi:hypothetical protein
MTGIGAVITNMDEIVSNLEDTNSRALHEHAIGTSINDNPGLGIYVRGSLFVPLLCSLFCDTKH